MRIPEAVLTSARSAPLRGVLRVPGDKSITHRALILAALAHGESHLSGALDALDTRATANALARLGAKIDWLPRAVVRVTGTGGHWHEPESPLDLGNSGTGLRLLAGALVGRGVMVTLTGDDSLRRRPMERVVRPLRDMGAEIATRNGRAPLSVGPAQALQGIRYRLSIPSAQVKSALLLAGLAAEGQTHVTDPYGTRDHSERLLPQFGAALGRHAEEIVLRPGRLAAADVEIPGDFSAAAFLIAAALAVPGSELGIIGVGINPTRTGFLRVLRRMGATIEIRNERQYGEEPVADLRVNAATLHGTTVSASEVPSLIDELPVLIVLSASATGATIVEGAGELRVKESDRIEAMRTGLAALGTDIRVEGDRITIPGGGLLRGSRVSAHDDHRVAMAFAVAGLMAPGAVDVEGAEWIATSFPDFRSILASAGAHLKSGS